MKNLTKENDFILNQSSIKTIYFAGGCLWGVQHFMRSLKGVISTQAGRVNGTSNSLDGEYDGYAECVKTEFDSNVTSVTNLTECFFEIIDPYSINKQGPDSGKKYRTGIYSEDFSLLEIAKNFIAKRDDKDLIAVEILPMSNYIPSAEEHQDRLLRCPEDFSICHIPLGIMNKYRD